MNKKESEGPPPEIFKKLDCKCCNQRNSGALFVVFFFFRFRSNSVLSGAVRSYAKDIDVFEKVGDRAKRGLQWKGVHAPGVLPWKFKKKTTLRIVQSELFWSFTCE